MTPWPPAGLTAWPGAGVTPSPEDLDRGMAGLPIIRELDAGVRTEALPIYAYETFADDLNKGTHGP